MRHRHLTCIFGLIAATVLLCACPAGAQAGAPAVPAGSASAATQPVIPTAADKQKAMQADMTRLLQLARQLKAAVDKSRKDELSMQVIREADEIEKLARSARSRIR